jgi:hypothetical protein
MAQHAARHYPAAGELPRWMLVGAGAGAVSVLVFQQAALALLQMFGFSDLALVWPLVAWGGIWSALLAATGIVPLAILAAAFLNGAWGLGTGIGLALFGRPRASA